MTTRATRNFEALQQGTILDRYICDPLSPQAVALRQKAENKGVLVKLGMFKYAVITDIPVFLSFLTTEPKEERNWYVVATDSDNKRGWLDFEFEVGLDECDNNGEVTATGSLEPKILVQFFADLYIAEFNKYYSTQIGFEITRDHMLWSKDHRPSAKAGYFKYSWHVVLNIQHNDRIYLFENIAEEGRFIQLVLKYLSKMAAEKNPHAVELLKQKQPDTSVYSRNRAFRLLHCSKYVNDQTTLEVDVSLNTVGISSDCKHFPIYHQSLGIQVEVLPTIKGKRKLEQPTGVLVGSSPITIRSANQSDVDRSISPISPPSCMQAELNFALRPRYRLSTDTENGNKGQYFAIRSLPQFPAYSEITGIIRSMFRRCPREYDVVRYVEENGLQISQVKPWSEKYPNTFIYRFDSSPDKSCPNDRLHHSNGTTIIWSYDGMEQMTQGLDDNDMPNSDNFTGFGRLEHKCLDPECEHGNSIEITRHYGDHYSMALTPYWIPVDVIYRVITLSVNITSVIAWLIRRLVGSDSGIVKLTKTSRSWHVWNGLIWESSKDPSNKLSGFLDLYISSIQRNFNSGLQYWQARPSNVNKLEEVKKYGKYISYALEELLRHIRNVATVQSALTIIEETLTVPATQIDGPPSEGWIVIGRKYLDMRTGIFHCPIPSLYISQVISTPWRGAETVEKDLLESLPMLDSFYQELFGDRKDSEYEPFLKDLQMYLGYSLTGTANLHTVVFLYGSGRNGKGLLCRLFKSTLLDKYVQEPCVGSEGYDPAEEFKGRSNIRLFLQIATIEERLRKARRLSRKGTLSGAYTSNNLVTNLDKKIISKNARSAENAHTAQLMGLLGARCVIFDELNAREELDLAKFKQYTGGDAIVVRAAYNKDSFVIQKPMFTFLITTNVLPGIAPEPSIVSRIKVIQFNVFFDPLMTDAESETRCRKRGNFEREDIIKSLDMKCEFLRWLMRGALLFYKYKRIDWCRAILRDTNDFWGQSDIFKMFIDDLFEVYELRDEIKQDNIVLLVQNGYCIKVGDFESKLASYYNEKKTPGNQIIPSQRVYQRLLDEYNVFKTRTAKGGLKRAVYLFGLRLL